MKRFVWSIICLGAAACSQDPIQARPQPAGDYNRAKLVAAVDKFVAAARSPAGAMALSPLTVAAYKELADTVVTLRPGMDKTVAAEAELRVLTLALEAEQRFAKQPLGLQAPVLATAVWPTLLAPPIAADERDPIVDPKTASIPAAANEPAGAYLERLCGGPLATTCKHIVPEYQGVVVGALAIRDATERTRTALSECLECTGSGADPGWQAARAGWEALDRDAATQSIAAEVAGDPHNWPIAGAASDDAPTFPRVQLAANGDLIGSDDASYGPTRYAEAFTQLRGKSDGLALELRPETMLATVRALLDAARTARCPHVVVIAREPVYPYRVRAYAIAEGSGVRASLRPEDSLQLLLHAIDEIGQPGAVARVD